MGEYIPDIPMRPHPSMPPPPFLSLHCTWDHIYVAEEAKSDNYVFVEQSTRRRFIGVFSDRALESYDGLRYLSFDILISYKSSGQCSHCHSYVKNKVFSRPKHACHMAVDSTSQRKNIGNLHKASKDPFPSRRNWIDD